MTNAKDIVMKFVDALERKDFKTVRSDISDNISVIAPGPVEITRFNQAGPYVTYLKHANLPRFEIRRRTSEKSEFLLRFLPRW